MNTKSRFAEKCGVITCDADYKMYHIRTVTVEGVKLKVLFALCNGHRPRVKASRPIPKAPPRRDNI